MADGLTPVAEASAAVRSPRRAAAESMGMAMEAATMVSGPPLAVGADGNGISAVEGQDTRRACSTGRADGGGVMSPLRAGNGVRGATRVVWLDEGCESRWERGIQAKKRRQYGCERYLVRRLQE